MLGWLFCVGVGLFGVLADSCCGPSRISTRGHKVMPADALWEKLHMRLRSSPSREISVPDVADFLWSVLQESGEYLVSIIM